MIVYRRLPIPRKQEVAWEQIGGHKSAVRYYASNSQHAAPESARLVYAIHLTNTAVVVIEKQFTNFLSLQLLFYNNWSILLNWILNKLHRVLFSM